MGVFVKFAVPVGVCVYVTVTVLATYVGVVEWEGACVWMVAGVEVYKGLSGVGVGVGK